MDALLSKDVRDAEAAVVFEPVSAPAPCVAAAARGGFELLRGEEGYPSGFEAVELPPPRICVMGSARALREGLAIVGARKATPYGKACAKRFAGIAAEMGVPVVSGGAIGCDQAAHEGALKAGGVTVAVLGCGADVVYPKSSEGIFRRAIASGGAVISEMPWGSPPQRWAFRMRNRLIAGLAKAVLIVEAGLPSGTFSTADYALGMGKDVMVVPGSILSKESRGSNKLLRDGALPIVDDESFSDEMMRLFPETNLRLSASAAAPERLEDASQRKVFQAVAASPMTPDELSESFGMGLVEVLHVLSKLEARGLAVRFPDGRFGVGADRERG